MAFENPIADAWGSNPAGASAIRAIAARKKAENLERVAEDADRLTTLGNVNAANAASAFSSSVSTAQNMLSGATIDGVTSGVGLGGTVVTAAVAKQEEAKAALSTNTWVASASDDVAVKDAYEVNGSSPITKIQNLMDASDLSFADVMRGGKWMASQVPLAASLLSRGKAVFTAKGLAARIIGASSLTNSLLQKLSPGAMGGILDMVSDNKQLFASVSGVVSRVASTNLTDIRAVGGLLSSVTGDKNLFKVDDQDSTVGLFAGIIHEATSLGIPGSFSALTSQITNTNLLGQIANKTLPSILQKADALGLKDMASALGDHSLLSLRPSALKDFGAYFAIPELATSGDVSKLFGDVSGCFRTVSSTWDQATRVADDGTESSVLNLTSLMGMNNDMRAVFTTGSMQADNSDTNTKLYGLVNAFTPQSVDDSLARSFPQVVPSVNTTINERSVDPDLNASNPGLQSAKSKAGGGFGFGALEGEIDETIPQTPPPAAPVRDVETISPKGGNGFLNLGELPYGMPEPDTSKDYTAVYKRFESVVQRRSYEEQTFGRELSSQERAQLLAR